MLGFSPIPPSLSKRLFWAMSLAVAGEASFYVVFRKTGEPLWAALSGLSVLILLFGAVLLVRAFGLFRPLAEKDRSV
jgi:hypothetical protein